MGAIAWFTALGLAAGFFCGVLANDWWLRRQADRAASMDRHPARGADRFDVFPDDDEPVPYLPAEFVTRHNVMQAWSALDDKQFTRYLGERREQQP